jgi:Flp pilus assembly secretin CpaC
MTIIDTPTNLARVGNYLNSLPELRRRRQQQVVFLEHAVAESLASDLVSILGLRGALAGVETGETVVRRLRRGEEFTFRDLRIRAVRMDENDVNDRLDDSVELNIISGTQSSNINLRELDTTFYENYEITAQDIQATDSTQNPGEGVARILIRYVGSAAERERLAEEEIQAEQEISEEEGVSIFPFGQLNALIIRYDNPAVLQDILELIGQLDLPTPQVEVETRFVQVNEQRAREFSANFGLENLVNGQNLNTDFFNFNAGFARATDEIRDAGDFPLENPWAANLLNSSTTLDFILGTGVPGLSFQLRMLEAEGVLNIVNGPKVTMLDNEEGEFRIERGSPYPQTSPIGQITPFVGPGEREIGQTTISNAFATSTDENLEFETGQSLGNRVSAVVLLVTPQVTSEKSIIFEITAEILDLDNFIGSQIFAGSDPFTQQINAVDNDLRAAAVREQERLVASHLKMLADLEAAGFDTGAGFADAANTLLATSLDGLAEIVSAANPFDFQSRARANASGTISQVGMFSPGQVLRTRKLINTRARTSDGGTIVLGGWTGERTIESTSGVPVLRNMPYIGKLFFSRNARSSDRTTLLIFLTAHIID